LDDALIEFKAIHKSAKNVTGAEALYHIAKIQFLKQDYEAVEKTVTTLVGYEYSNDNWNTKGLLLLSDAYIAKGEDADAELMLQTVVGGKPKQEYIDEANAKLDILKAKKAKLMDEEKQRQNNEMKVEFKEQNGDKLLFEPLNQTKQDTLINPN
jgi:hypothetical protein